jgi:hypothetical protein
MGFLKGISSDARFQWALNFETIFPLSVLLESGGQGTINKCQKEMNGLKCNQTCQNTKLVEGETWRCGRERYKRPGDKRPGENTYRSPYCGSKTCLTESQKREKGWFQLQPEKN